MAVSYYGRGDLLGPQKLPQLDLLGYGDADWPDPLAGDLTRFQRLWDAWDALEAKKESKVGYYGAGDITQTQTSHTIGGGSSPRASSEPAPKGGDAYEERRYKRNHRVLNLSALSRAQRRIDRATRIAAKLFQHKKQGTHGLVMRKRRRRK